jgi:internalin A
MNKLLYTSSAAKWFLTLLVVLPSLTACGCGKSDEKLFKEAVQKVAAGQADNVNVHSFPKVGDKEVSLLADATNLKYLNLDRSRITDEGLKNLPWLPRLTNLSLSNTQVTDAGMEALTKLQNLEVLRLDRTRVKNAGLSIIAELPNLKNLSLWKCVIDDEGVAYLSKLRNLERLSLDETLISDAALKHLAPLSRLRYLSVWRTKVSDAGVNELQKALPSVKVNR